MNFEAIEAILGADAVRGVRKAVEAAFVSSRQVGANGPEALENLLLAMLVATVVTPSDYEFSESRIRDCCLRLEKLAGETRARHQQTSGGGRPN